MIVRLLLNANLDLSSTLTIAHALKGLYLIKLHIMKQHTAYTVQLVSILILQIVLANLNTNLNLLNVERVTPSMQQPALAQLMLLKV